MAEKVSNQQIRVLHVYRTYFPDPPGGLQEAIRQMALATTKLGISNRIFALSPEPFPPLINYPEGQVIRAKSWAAPASCDLGGLQAMKLLRDMSKQSDLFHFQFPWPYADAMHAVLHSSLPAVMTYHSDIVRQKWLGKIYAPLMWKTLKAMKFIVATSPAYMQTSPVLSHPAIREKVRVIPLGVDDDLVMQHSDETVFRRLNIGKDEPYFLFVGVLRYYKGLHNLIQAAPSVDAKIVIAGSGPEESSLKLLAQRLQVKNVVFAGRVTEGEKGSLMQACRALVLSSQLRSEAFGMVLVEASVWSRPMITCEIGTGTSYVNAHEETGFVIPPEAPAQLAYAMNELLINDELTERLGKAARARYDQLFSAERLGAAYASLYKEALE